MSNDKLNDVLTWEEECMHWHGRVLTGEKAHLCADWDFLPIDETMPEELACCTCPDAPNRIED